MDTISNIRSLPLTSIIADPDCQLRAAGSGATIADYAEALKTGATFPPVIVFSDGIKFWLADGYRVVSDDNGGIIRPDSLPYLNNTSSWSMLVNASRDARYLSQIEAYRRWQGRVAI